MSPMFGKDRFNRRGDHLCTPVEIVDLVRRILRGRIALDPCSNRWSIVGADVELRAGGLEADWHRLGPSGYWNPPYSGSQIPEWWAKAKAEAELGFEHVGLLHCDTSTEWHRDVARIADARAYPPRINFLDRGRLLRGNQYAQVLVYQGPHVDVFARECALLWGDRVLLEGRARRIRRRIASTGPILGTDARARIGARSFSARTPRAEAAE